MTNTQNQNVVPLLETISFAIKNGNIIFITESHADASLLRKHGFPAICGYEPDEYVVTDPGFFTGAEVAVLHNNSETSFHFAEDMKAALKHFAHSVRTRALCEAAKDNVSAFLQQTGYDFDLFRKIISATMPTYAPWITPTDKGLKVNADILADSISRNVSFLNVRKSGDVKQRLYLYKKGAYRHAADIDMMAMVRRYLPVGLGKSSLLKEVEKLLLCQEEKICTMNDLDVNTDFINLENGLLNIYTMELEPHTPTLKSTLQLNTGYDPDDHEMPVFRRFLKTLFSAENGGYDHEREAVLQEFCGFAISNLPGLYLKKALMLYSPNGNTGKSQVLGLLGKLIGIERTANISIQAMGSGNRFALGPAIGKRLISVGDQSGSVVKDSSVFKMLTGGDTINPEEKYQNSQAMTWNGTIIFAANNLPTFKDDFGDHVFERFTIIPFYNVIPKEERDPEILNKMLSEKPAILNWMLEGLTRLINNGYKLSHCTASDEVMEEYRRRQDTVFAFISANYEITKRSKDRVEKQIFQCEYESWCAEEDMDPVSSRELKHRLEAIGLRCAQARFGSRGGITAVYGLKKKSPSIAVA